MVIYVLRHGETDWNRQRLLQGRTDVALNENGRRLAKKTAEGMKEIPFDLVFTSPLSRAKETAKIVLGDRKIPVIEDERIIEISFGADEGKPWRKTKAFEGNPNIYHFFRQTDAYRPSEGGESIPELAERTADFLKDICSRKELADKTVLVSTHGAAMRGILNSLRTWEISDFWGGGVAPNCGVAVIECLQGRQVLLEENRIYYDPSEVVKYD